MKTCFSKLPALLLATLLVASCSQTKKGQDAEVADAKEVTEVEESAEIYKIDTDRSVITWIGSKPTGQHNGIIPISEGEIAVLDRSISGGKVAIDITGLEIKDLKAGSEDHKKLSNHLMSDDFFAAEQFPDGTFEITSVVPFDTATMVIEDKQEFKSKNAPATMSEFMVANPTHRITGNLTLRGVTKSISFPATVVLSGDNIKAEAKFNIDRTDWNLSYGDEASVADKAQDQFIYNTVNVGLSLNAVKGS